MSRKSVLPKSRHHIWAYDEDWAYLRDLQRLMKQPIEPGALCCEIIHRKVKELRQRQVNAIDQMESQDVS